MHHKSEDMIAQKQYTDYQLPNNITMDFVHAKVFELHINHGMYRGYEEKYGVEVTFKDEIFNGGEFEYYHTLGIDAVNPGGFKAFYIKMMKDYDVFESIEEMIVKQITVAEREAVENLREPANEPAELDEQTTEERADAALDALEDMQEDREERELGLN